MVENAKRQRAAKLLKRARYFDTQAHDMSDGTSTEAYARRTEAWIKAEALYAEVDKLK